MAFTCWKFNGMTRCCPDRGLLCCAPLTGITSTRYTLQNVLQARHVAHDITRPLLLLQMIE